MTAKLPAIVAVPEPGDARRPGWRIRWAARQDERRRRGYDDAIEEWRRRADELTRLRVETTCFQGCYEPRTGLPVDLLDGEVVFRVLPAAELVEAEARHIPGLPTPGLTVPPVAAGTQNRALPRGLRVVDAGMAVVTDRRVAFAGRLGLREWWYADLTGPAHHPHAPVTLLHTTSGEKLAGLRVPAHSALNFRFYLTLAYADVLGDRAAVAAYLDELVTDHERARPVAPAQVGADQAPWAALLLDRRMAVAAAAVAMFVAAAVVGMSGPGGLSPITALGASATDAVGTDVPTSGSAVPTTGAPAATGPDGILTPPGRPAPGGLTAAPGATGGVPAGSMPAPGPGIPGSPTKAPQTPGPVPSSGAAPTTAPPSASPTPVDLCGAPQNPYGYNYCAGSRIRHPAADVCNYFACIENFWSSTGHLMQCGDGRVGLVGPKSSSCAAYGGATRYVYRPYVDDD